MLHACMVKIAMTCMNDISDGMARLTSISSGSMPDMKAAINMTTHVMPSCITVLNAMWCRH